MSFLNIALLGGMAACLAPLVIHLLNRSRFRPIDWGAMHLLEAAMQVNSRRFQWESLLLLIIRCAIPITLALCLARPVLTYSRMANAQGKKSIVMVIDDSLSMTVDGGQNLSLFEVAVNELEAISKKYRSAEQSLWSAGVRPTNLIEGSTLDASRLEESLRQVRPGTGNIDVFSAISAAARQLTTMTNPSKHLVFASDFREADWNKFAASDIATFRDELAGFETPVQLSLLKVSRKIQNSDLPPDNLSVNLPGSFELKLLPNEVGDFAFKVSNFGHEAVESVQVIFSVDDREIAKRSVNVKAGDAALVSFACKFIEPGWHTIACRVEGDTGPSFDDSLQCVVQVIQPLRVLLISERRVEVFQASIDYLRLALTPFADQKSDLNRFQVETAEARTIVKNMLENQQVVILAGVRRLDEESSNLLVEFVRAGGGLVVFPDDNLDSDWFNRRFYEQDPLLPTKFGGKVGDESTFQPLLRETIQYPELQIFNKEQAGDLAEWEFQAWQRLVQPHDKALVILKLSGGDPFLVTQPFGSGHVHQCAVSCYDNWSNMPLKSPYVPFMQQLTQSASAGSEAANLRCGETTVISVKPVVGDRLTNAAAAREDSIQLFALREIASNGTDEALTFPLQVNDVGTAVFAESRFPGLFRFAFADSTLAENNSLSEEESLEPPWVSILGAESESNLKIMNDARLRELADQLGATVVHSAEEFDANVQLRQVGREIWRWLLAALLALLVAEVLVVRGIHRGVGG